MPITDRFQLGVLGLPPESLLGQLAEVQQFAEIHVAETPEQAGALSPETEVLFTLGHTGTWIEQHWRSLGKLRWIHSGSTGVEDILFPALQSGSVILTNSRGAYASPLAEFVMFCVLFFAKAFPVMERNRQEHRWKDYPLKEVRRQTIGIVGFGETGQAVSRLAQAFGMDILAMRRNLQGEVTKKDNEEVAQFIPGERWHELLSASDYVVNALPLTTETLGKFGEREFSAMKMTGYFINVGRGRTVQESTLVRALKEGWIAGAALDVCEAEPLSQDSELYSLPNVVLSPHCADKVASSSDNVNKIFVENVRRYAKGLPLLNIVNKQIGY